MANSRPDNGNRQTPQQPSGRPKKIDPLKLRRTPRPEDENYDNSEPLSVSAGPIDRVIELAFNPTREKIREVTIIDRLQGRLFPIMDAMNTLYRNCIEVATYRQSLDLYKELYHKSKPAQMDIMDEMMFRIAQWQKSVAGKNLERATDIALAETEVKAGEEGEPITGRGYDE